MADIIRLLPESVANQIAAGEVVQRPSSVVKELVENAVDAGATNIDLIIEDAGKTSIQVIDDGKGMSESDARLAFERHATSKIRQASDLFSLSTMGFRGEALPSIASVAQVHLITKTIDSDLGTELHIEGNEVVSQEPVACKPGSNFLVENLFFNVPARRRFLKSNQTEISNIVQEFERVALVNPSISFTLTSNKAKILNLPAESLRKRISSTFGKRIGENLLEVGVKTSLCNITGYVGRPESSKKKGALQFFFVNGRFMRHPYFHKAVQEAYEGLLPAGEQVPYFIYFEVEPSSIDVNIHPTKTEIKFENEVAIWQIIVSAVREALGKFNAVPIMDFDEDGRPDDFPVFPSPTQEKGKSMHAPPVQYNTSYNPFKASTAKQIHNSMDWNALYSGIEKAKIAHSMSDEQQAECEQIRGDEISFLQNEIARSSVHYQYRGQYIFTSVGSGVMVIDQHRAHVRILYNRYMRSMESSPHPSQRLLFPEMVQVSARDIAYMAEIQDELSMLGFEISNLGGGSYSVQAVPAGLDGISPSTLLTQILDTLHDETSSLEKELKHRMAFSLARSAAIPVGQMLTQEEMEDIEDKLFQGEQPNYTPDGKKIVSILEHDIIAKMFK